MAPHNSSPDIGLTSGTAGEIFQMIRSAQSTSRAALAQQSGLAPSTISLRVDALMRLGLVRDKGEGESNGGRRSRLLEVNNEAGYIAAIDVGANHVKTAIVDVSGTFLGVTDQTASFGASPEAVVAHAWDIVHAQILELKLPETGLMGIGVGFPAPIEYRSGRVVLPSFMPGLHDAVIPQLFKSHTAVPVLVENDANLMAIAERAERADGESVQLLAVKLGTRIGCGIISEGRLHRGVGGAAGEISHTAVAGTATVGCSCGIESCLESVASGGAIAARLAAAGYDVKTASDVVELGQNADPEVVAALREAGTQIGDVLSSIVNFFNPGDVVLGGTMSASAPLVAAIRAQLFQQCLPLVTNRLDVRAAHNPSEAGIRGASIIILEEILAPARIDGMFREHDDKATQDKV